MRPALLIGAGLAALVAVAGPARAASPEPCANRATAAAPAAPAAPAPCQEAPCTWTPPAPCQG
ncbi:MAG: hypothetical protein ACKOZW_13935 [Cyanobium sp.]